MNQPEAKAKKGKSGSETRQRSEGVRIRLTADELAEVKAAADRAGLAIGSHGRAMLLNGKAPRAVRTPPVDRQALAQVLAQLGKSRLANNLNQIAHALNSGDRHDTDALDRALREITDMRNALMTALGREGAV